MDPTSADIDHRKKRRNRTTHSCINCHTTKRKCDRKRPCQRCTQLGLTGLCVYEVDDPNSPDDPNVDESTRLRKRIAELEGVIRELKNKPHPRWITQANDSAFHTRSQHNRNSSLSKKRKLDDLVGDKDIVDLSLLPDGQVIPSVKSEPQSVDFSSSGESFDMHAYDSRYTLHDPFNISSDEASSPNNSTISSDSPRAHRYHDTPTSPSSCECLSNATAFSSVTSLEQPLRAAINVLSNVRHSPQSENAPTDTRCSLLAEIARLQELIVASTRPTTPMLLSNNQPAPQHRLPLSVQVPVTFSDTIAPGLPHGFNLRQPPPPPGAAAAASNVHLPSPTHVVSAERIVQSVHSAGGIVTPPLSAHTHQTHSYPWESQHHHHHPHGSACNSPDPLTAGSNVPPPLTTASPALSSASSSYSGSVATSFGMATATGPMIAMEAAYQPFYAQQQHQSSHARFQVGTPGTPRGEYGFEHVDAFGQQHSFGVTMVRSTSGY